MVASPLVATTRADGVDPDLFMWRIRRRGGRGRHRVGPVARGEGSAPTWLYEDAEYAKEGRLVKKAFQERAGTVVRCPAKRTNYADRSRRPRTGAE